MKVSVIIVNYNVKYFLELCLHSVLKATQGIEAEVIVVDNNSKDDSCLMVKTLYPSVILIENNDNRGFSRANNQAVAIAKGEYILFLNPDTVMPEDFFQKTLAYIDTNPKVGALGPRLIDGKGQFAPDAKKSLPTLSVAFFKTTGINKLFPKSPYFNKYYAVHIGEHETSTVEVLSGCCMLVRSKVIKEIGGAFDEDYFMYCEDVDLCYRITKAGYQNIYFPEVNLIHYKGESTRKMTFTYVRIFNEALVKFVKKHYSKKDATLYLLFINMGIVLRAIIGALRLVLKVLRMPLFDAIVLFVTLYFIKDFWVLHIKNLKPIPMSSVYATFPVYIGLWILSMFLNGAYDQPYRPLRVTRGMIIGTVMILAYYGLLKEDLRYSRAIIIFTGFAGTVLLLGLHEILYRLGIVKLVPYDKLPKKAVIVANEKDYQQTETLLRKVHYAPELSGRISAEGDTNDALGTLTEMRQVLYTAAVNEVIFCIRDLSYGSIFDKMKECGKAYDYKLHLPGSQSFVGSNSSHTSGDLYTIERSFNLEGFGFIRNKRVLDIAFVGAFLLFLPVAIFFVNNPFGFIANCFYVLSGQRTWVSYRRGEVQPPYLPKIKKGIIPPYNLLNDYTPPEDVRAHLYMMYARGYTPGTDIMLVLKNFKYLGGS